MEGYVVQEESSSLRDQHLWGLVTDALSLTHSTSILSAQVTS